MLLRTGIGLEQSSKVLNVKMFSRFSIKGMNGGLEEEAIRSEMLTKLLVYVIYHRDRELSV